MTEPDQKLRIYIFLRRGLRGRRWYFRIVSTGNGEKLASSEGYHNRADCRATAGLLRAHLQHADIFEVGK